MDSLGDETWDAVLCGTGLQQSILALALSRSKKRILHVDPNDYYGQNEAALSLQDAEAWASQHSASDAGEAGNQRKVFQNASIWKHPEAEAQGLRSARSYSLALAPHIIHTKSSLLSQLVSSRAFRQLEFLAVGYFFVYEEAEGKLSRIPSSREDVFATQSIPAKSKRALMKFLKFVVDFESEENMQRWQDQSAQPLAPFLASEFSLDENLRKYILALTLTLDGKISVKAGLAAIHRHMTSIGMFGPGFCAVYPKWGGSSEIAQVGCRAGAVGGGIYMLGTNMEVVDDATDSELNLKLSNGISVQTSSLFSGQDLITDNRQTISRLVAIVKSPLKSLFEIDVEGAPVPGVVMIAFPGGLAAQDGEAPSELPIYASIHSSDTGECPVGQCAIYLTTVATPDSKQRVEQALDKLLKATHPADGEVPSRLYKLYYEQSASESTPTVSQRGKSTVFSFPPLPLNLAFNDGDLESVKTAWKSVMGHEAPEEDYMIFEDREGADEDDDYAY